MLDRSDVDAVVIGTPMQFHASQAVAALERGVHVLSEVTAGVSLEECEALVRACRESSATYMMAENYTYRRPNQIVKEMVRRGEFGKTYYAEGEYLHEVKGLNEITTWRRRWQTGVDGVTYGTHSLGPILQWMPGDRVERVCAAGSGRNHVDPRGDAYENQSSSVMLCQMRSGGLVKIRLDMLSDRPHAMTNYQLQGTDGCYESSRAPGEPGRVWLRSRDTANAGAGPYEGVHRDWRDLDELAEEFLPESWRVLRRSLRQEIGARRRRPAGAVRLRGRDRARRRARHRHTRGHGHDAAGAGQPAVDRPGRALARRPRLAALVDVSCRMKGS